MKRTRALIELAPTRRYTIDWTLGEGFAVNIALSIAIPLSGANLRV
jgi:hypothetical protein